MLIAACPGCACLPAHCLSLDAPSFTFSTGDLGIECIQALLPQAPVRAQPLVDLGERLGVKTVDPPLCLLADVHKPCLPQHSEVPRYSRASNGQLRRF